MKIKMRTEQEMMDTILCIARDDDRIRAVYMNGSRANPNVEKDQYRDYDIVFAVTDTESFIADKGWIENFGEIAIVQEPDLNDTVWGAKHDFAIRYAWLILFKDGNRIDLSIITLPAIAENYISDTLTVPLLDKDGMLPEIPESSDKGYWPHPPTSEHYRACCNEFWWCLNSVAKGIARRQLPYAMRMYTQVVHIELEKMIEWYIGMENDFSITTGMWGKYFEKYLPPELYAKYVATYSGGDYNDLWRAVFTACDLFRFTASKVGTYFGFTYCQDEDENTTDYLLKLKNNEFV